jgi:uncharacterized protein DUF72
MDYLSNNLAPGCKAIPGFFSHANRNRLSQGRHLLYLWECYLQLVAALRLLGTSGWKYNEPVEKGGWIGVFYPDEKTRFLKYYSQFFDTVEFDAVFYEKLYAGMSKGTFIGLSRATPENFQFSVKVPERITHKKKMSLDQGAFSDFEGYLEMLEPLKTYNKLGAILFQLPPYFTVSDFSKIEPFLDKLPKGYDYSVEFRHGSRLVLPCRICAGLLFGSCSRGMSACLAAFSLYCPRRNSLRHLLKKF